MGRHRLWVMKENAQMCYNHPISRSRRWESHLFNCEHLFSARFACTGFLYYTKIPRRFLICVCLTVLKQCLNCEVFLVVSAIHIKILLVVQVTDYSMALLLKTTVFGIQLLYNGALHSTVATMTVITAGLLTCCLSSCDGL